MHLRLADLASKPHENFGLAHSRLETPMGTAEFPDRKLRWDQPLSPEFGLNRIFFDEFGLRGCQIGYRGPYFFR